MSNPHTHPVNYPLNTHRRRGMPPRIPQAAHRHAGPSGPWPFLDATIQEYQFVSPEEQRQLDELYEESQGFTSSPWKQYPRSLFPNWTYPQQKASGLLKLILPETAGRNSCNIHHVEVAQDGSFNELDLWTVDKDNELAFWKTLEAEDDVLEERKSRVKMFFVDNMSGSIMQMLGTKYNVEPFFFSSSLNWIPTRYQESLSKGESDHITLTLTFLRALESPVTRQNSTNTIQTPRDTAGSSLASPRTHIIDTQAPLVISSSNRILSLDLLSLHMVRKPSGSTVISFHPSPEWRATTARHLHSRVSTAGGSVYWQNLFKDSTDPTLVLLVMLWYPLYAWDEALEVLYEHICWLESKVLATNDIHITRQLHVIRASLLHYQTLLEEFRKTVDFLLATPNPSMEFDDNNSTGLSDEELERRKHSRACLEKECNTLLGEISRLEQYVKMHGARMDNVVNLTFNSVSFEDAQYMRSLSEASLHDSKIVKQISYLTMVFLPASFVSSFFGMNVGALVDGAPAALSLYFAAAIPLTVITIWLIFAIHGGADDSADGSIWFRIIWPFRHGTRALRRLYRWCYGLLDRQVASRRTRKAGKDGSLELLV